jgi:hypothetical protein
MWQMVCDSDITVSFEVLRAAENDGCVRLVDEYTNPIESRFQFRDGLIVEQFDSCDAPKWIEMAIGGVSGRCPLRPRHRGPPG